MYALIIDNDNDYGPPDTHGPFATIEDGQLYARNYRRVNGIPGHAHVEPTPEENEAWSAEGWQFAIVEMKLRSDLHRKCETCGADINAPGLKLCAACNEERLG